MELVYLTFILILSIFLGFELIQKVPATLHTPLMSGANAISGITLVGALVGAGSENSTTTSHRLSGRACATQASRCEGPPSEPDLDTP